MLIVLICHPPKQKGHMLNNGMLPKKKFAQHIAREYYATNAEKYKEASKLTYENKKDPYKKAYANDPEKFKEASKKAYANDPERLGFKR